MTTLTTYQDSLKSVHVLSFPLKNSYFWPKRYAIWTATNLLAKPTILDRVVQNLVCWTVMI